MSPVSGILLDTFIEVADTHLPHPLPICEEFHKLKPLHDLSRKTVRAIFAALEHSWREVMGTHSPSPVFVSFLFKSPTSADEALGVYLKALLEVETALAARRSVEGLIEEVERGLAEDNMKTELGYLEPMEYQPEIERCDEPQVYQQYETTEDWLKKEDTTAEPSRTGQPDDDFRLPKTFISTATMMPMKKTETIDEADRLRRLGRMFAGLKKGVCL
ncbi:hypothetical protein CspeluHIS016_0501810 [Cutaneotrichosporon spelunceum]|uniref:Uncharacterized protein n=1 Tax=Cutaneotrichosporon spelunceum TaxID=1672016 RepID=A0AAD3YDP4_9TREE|nr:hypothetical protein CspeluHIS016_0501810 [Cutaneotrichosporon spelunceum]